MLSNLGLVCIPYIKRSFEACLWSFEALWLWIYEIYFSFNLVCFLFLFLFSFMYIYIYILVLFIHSFFNFLLSCVWVLLIINDVRLSDISTNICSKSKMISDDSILAKTSRTTLLVIYCASSLILFVQISLRGRERPPVQVKKPQTSPYTLVQVTLLNTA